MLKKKNFILVLLSLAFLVTGHSFALESDRALEGEGHSVFDEFFEIEKPKLFFSNLVEDSEGNLLLEEEEYSFNPGEKITLVAEANQGFYFTHWEVDGQKVSEANEFVFTMPNKNVTLIGVFKKIVNPSVKIISPGNNESFEVLKDIPVRVQAESPNGKVTRVELLRNGIVIGSINDPTNSFIVSNLQIGTHSLTARVTDDKGARATSSAVTILVTEPNKVPIVSITSPKPAEVFPEGVDIRIEANASDPDGSISKVEFYRGSVLVGTSTTSPYIVTMPKVAPGSYNLTAKAFDNRNATAISSVVNVVVEKANVAPTVNISSPKNGDEFVVGSNIRIEAQASDSDGRVTKVEFYRGNVLIGTATSAPFAVTWSNVTLGSHSLTAKAFDDKGASVTSSAITILVTEPNKVPIVSITSPKPADVFPEGVDVRIEADASDPDGSISKVEFYRGSVLVGTSTTSPYIVTIPKMAPGSYNLTAKAFDNKNATAISSVVNVVVEKANVAPSVNISSPKNGDEFVVGSNIRIEAQASDSDGKVNKVEFYRGNVLIGTATSAPFAVTWSNVTIGTHSLTAKAFDDKGASRVSAAININVLSELAIPEISLVTPIDDQVIEEGNTVAFTVMFNGDSKHVKRVEYYAGTQLLGTSATSPYNFDWKNVPVGEYELKAVVIGGTPEKIKNSNVVKLSVKPKPTIPFEITAPLRNSKVATGSDLTISVQVPDSFKKINRVEYFRGNVKIGQSTTAPYDFVWKNVSTGEYNLVSRLVYDDNTVILSPVVKIFVEPFPGLSINYLVLDKPGQEDVEVQFTPTFIDLKSPVANVQYFVDENLVGDVDRDPFVLSLRGILPGTYKVYAVAKDENGLEFESEVVMMEIKGEVAAEPEPEPILSYVIGPNPTSDFLNIHFSELEEDQEFQINVISMNGHINKVFVAKTTDSSITIDVSNLKNGIYAIHLQSSGRYISGDKFIKR